MVVRMKGGCAESKSRHTSFRRLSLPNRKAVTSGKAFIPLSMFSGALLLPLLLLPPLVDSVATATANATGLRPRINSVSTESDCPAGAIVAATLVISARSRRPVSSYAWDGQSTGGEVRHALMTTESSKFLKKRK
jgi:hypothetical protein